MIRAAVFDIDDTLYDMKTKQFISSAIKGLKALQKKGILVILATGRPPITAKVIQQEGIFPDYIVCTNGHLILNKADNILSERSFDKELSEAVYRYCLEHQIGLVWKYSDKSYEYIHADVFENFYNKTKDSRKNVIFDQKDIHMLRNPNGGCLGCGPEELERFNRQFEGRCVAVRIDDASSDLMVYGVNKKNAVELLLNQLGISRDECIAFGDNMNDLEILQYAGIGVCMGNGSEELKKKADYVTDDLKNNGILHALKHFDLI